MKKIELMGLPPLVMSSVVEMTRGILKEKMKKSGGLFGGEENNA